ncbi:MAG: hypothetical protein ACI8Y7_000217 [Candidatus Woesearchaeota archaeon]|jgi:hypothetical protein
MIYTPGINLLDAIQVNAVVLGNDNVVVEQIRDKEPFVGYRSLLGGKAESINLREEMRRELKEELGGGSNIASYAGNHIRRLDFDELPIHFVGAYVLPVESRHPHAKKIKNLILKFLEKQHIF